MLQEWDFKKNNFDETISVYVIIIFSENLNGNICFILRGSTDFPRFERLKGKRQENCQELEKRLKLEPAKIGNCISTQPEGSGGWNKERNQCWQITLNPTSRRVFPLCLQIQSSSSLSQDGRFHYCLGGGNAFWREADMEFSRRNEILFQQILQSYKDIGLLDKQSLLTDMLHNKMQLYILLVRFYFGQEMYRIPKLSIPVFSLRLLYTLFIYLF